MYAAAGSAASARRLRLTPSSRSGLGGVGGHAERAVSGQRLLEHLGGASMVAVARRAPAASGRAGGVGRPARAGWTSARRPRGPWRSRVRLRPSDGPLRRARPARVSTSRPSKVIHLLPSSTQLFHERRQRRGLLVQATQVERLNEAEHAVPRADAVDPVEAGQPRLRLRRLEEFHHLVGAALVGQVPRQ